MENTTEENKINKKKQKNSELPKKSKSVKEVKKDVKERNIDLDANSKIAAIPIVAQGHLVSVEYTGTLDDGEEFDSSKDNGPINFIVGSNQVIRGFDDAVIGMKLNESKNIKINRSDAYGDINPSLKHKIAMEKIPEDMRSQLKIGGFLIMQSPIGQEIPVKIDSIDNNELTVDLNHPLAGKDLTFNIKVLDISMPTKEDLDALDNENNHTHDDHDSSHDKHNHANKEECGCGDDCGDESDDCCGGNCGCNH